MIHENVWNIDNFHLEAIRAEVILFVFLKKPNVNV